MIGKNKLRKTINIVLIISTIFFISCVDDKKKIIKSNDKVEILKIDGKELLNQAIYYDEEGSIDYSKSQFYKIDDKKCIKYYSMHDTLKKNIGVDRFIVFKTSDLLKSDFSNIDKIKLEEYFFKNKNSLCLNRKSIPNYGVIEDVVFFKTDTIINGEKSKRIKTIYQYINFKKKPNWVELK
jgi:hypothetical protein